MSFEDHRDIERLMFGYARSVDRADWSEIGRLFTYGRVLTNNSPDVTEGGPAVADLWRTVNKVHEDGTLRTRHLLTNIDIEIDGDEARAESYFMVFQATDRTPLQPIAGGSYVDKFRRRTDGWWFDEKFIYIDLIGNVSDHLAIVIDQGPVDLAALRASGS